MSVATSRGEGDVELSFIYSNYNHHKRSHQRYLQRNVRKSLQSLTMGSASSFLKNTFVATLGGGHVPPDPDDEDDEDPRPAKRRKITTPDDINSSHLGERRPFSHVTNESSRGPARLSSKPDLVPPPGFYGNPNLAPPDGARPKLAAVVSNSSKGSLDAILPKRPADFNESLRVDVLELKSQVPEDCFLSPFGPPESPIEIKCRCSVAIFYAKNDENPGDVRPRDYAEICRIVKTGLLRVTFGPDGEATRNIILPEPFVFSPEHFYVNRKTRKPNGQFASEREFVYTFGFADRYNLQVFLEPVKFHEEWPPVHIPALDDLNAFHDEDHPGDPSAVSEALDSKIIERADLHLWCSTGALLNPTQQDKAISLQICHKSMKQPISYSLKVQIRWALPSHLSTLSSPSPNQKFESPRTVAPATVSNREFMASPSKPETVSASNSPANRSHRQRTNVPATYNLKALSAQAQGKSPRVRRPRDPRSKSDGCSENDGVSVTYAFGRADAVESGIKQQTTVSSLTCPFCNSRNQTVDELRLHLHTNHSYYKFHLRRSNPPRIMFFIEMARSRSGPAMNIERARTFQLGKPMSLFNLEKHVAGDESWTKIRQGPDHNEFPDHLKKKGKGHDSSLSSSPRDSRYSSPNTSNDTDDVPDFGNSKSKPIWQRKVLYVPKTPKPLYDTVTKRRLEPGEEIPGSDDEKEESWLHQKHRDLINDFTDVTADEKDYINHWNPFIVEEHLTSDKHLPEAVLRFVETNKIWFTERSTRKVEFMKHMETFVLKDVLDEKVVHTCAMIIKAAQEKAGKKGDADMERVEEEAPRSNARGLQDCICGSQTQNSDRVVCTGRVSYLRIF